MSNKHLQILSDKRHTALQLGGAGARMFHQLFRIMQVCVGAWCFYRCAKGFMVG